MIEKTLHDLVKKTAEMFPNVVLPRTIYVEADSVDIEAGATYYQHPDTIIIDYRTIEYLSHSVPQFRKSFLWKALAHELGHMIAAHNFQRKIKHAWVDPEYYAYLFQRSLGISIRDLEPPEESEKQMRIWRKVKRISRDEAKSILKETFEEEKRRRAYEGFLEELRRYRR